MVDCGICPNCGSKLVKKDGRFGSFISCSNFPKCRFSMNYKPENINLDFKSLDTCPNCGGKLIKKSGSKGDFLGCSNYPKCKFSMNYNQINAVNKVKEGNNCPKCGASLIEKNGKFGAFLGCSNYPDCDFTKNISLKHEKPKDKIKKTKIDDNTFSFQDAKYKSKVKLAKEFVVTNLNITVKELLILKDWDGEVSLCMNIIDDKVTNDDEIYIEKMLGYAHHRQDKRSSLEYACDLIVGWIIEDCIVEILKSLGYNTSLNSADKNRKLLLNPTADSDLKISINGKYMLIEQVNDFTGYWKKTLHVPMRDNKYKNLAKENSLLFGIDFKNELFFMLDVSKTEANYIPYHRPFSKPAYALKITNNDFYNLDQVEHVFSNLLSTYK